MKIYNLEKSFFHLYLMHFHLMNFLFFIKSGSIFLALPNGAVNPPPISRPLPLQYISAIG